eukprot:9477007-Pyramimonas_sp.AAC.3
MPFACRISATSARHPDSMKEMSTPCCSAPASTTVGSSGSSRSVACDCEPPASLSVGHDDSPGFDPRISRVKGTSTSMRFSYDIGRLGSVTTRLKFPVRWTSMAVSAQEKTRLSSAAPCLDKAWAQRRHDEM